MRSYSSNVLSELTQLLHDVEAGTEQATERLLPLVYEELRRLASHMMSHEPQGHTLQATALVHEAWIRLGGSSNPQWNGRNHFFGAAAEAMRRILIDRARKRQSRRHGHGLRRIDISQVDVAAATDDDTLLALDELLDKLAVEAPEKVELIKLRFYVGLSIPDAAKELGISEATAKRHWAFARAWLFSQLKRLN